MRWGKGAIIVWTVLGGGLMVPTGALATGADRTGADATEIGNPSLTDQTQAPEGDDSEVKSRGPGVAGEMKQLRPPSCTGTVHVPYYPDASFPDLPGAITLATIENPNLPQNIPVGAPPK